MIPASAYASGTGSYAFEPAALLGARASDILDDGTSVANGLIDSASRPIVPGEAVFYLPGFDTIGMESVQPIYRVTATDPTATAARFAGILANDIWQGRNDAPIASHIDSQANVVVAQPNTMQPIAVEREWWLPLGEVITSIPPNSQIAVITAAGATQGQFGLPGAGKLSLPATALVYTGRVAVVRGRRFAVGRFPVRLRD